MMMGLGHHGEDRRQIWGVDTPGPGWEAPTHKVSVSACVTGRVIARSGIFEVLDTSSNIPQADDESKPKVSRDMMASVRRDVWTLKYGRVVVAHSGYGLGYAGRPRVLSVGVKIRICSHRP